ncbi:hypothetical protein [Ureaplasma diversum]|uniref:Uncharacterized protein n=1 Tax=Ureaplasma diversum NCTC 246 TaxID=1188241 RepID=A0A084EZ48_9BACT|nr:hypothetical protein [Ureaplasma diversum]KEZ23240.1 hypothetical protein UDIV_3770 [Ureaplasma diversum NCTC 246]
MKNDGFYTQILFAKYSITPKYIKGQKRSHDFEFYRSGRFIDYITRENAVYKQSDKPFDRAAINKFLRENNLTPRDYFQNNPPETKGLSGLMRVFDKEANYVDKEQAKKEMAELNDKQIIWEMTINLGQFGKENIFYNKYEWAQSLNSTIPFLLRKKNLKPSQVSGFYAIHKNTDYPHIHLCLYEKAPLRFNKKKEPVYTQKGQFDNKDINYFKHIFQQSFVHRAALEEMYDNQKQLIALKKNAKSMFQPKAYNDIKTNHTLFIQSIDFIRDELKDKKNISYKKLSEEAQKKVKYIFNELVALNDDLNKALKKYRTNLSEFETSKSPDEFFKLKKTQFVEKEEVDLNHYFYNQVVKMCLYKSVNELVKQTKIDKSGINPSARFRRNNNPFVKNKNYKPSSSEYIKQFRLNQDDYYAFIKKKQEALALFNNYIKYPYQLDNQTVYEAPNVPYYMKVNKLK